ACVGAEGADLSNQTIGDCSNALHLGRVRIQHTRGTRLGHHFRILLVCCLLQLFSRHRRGDELLAIDPHRATSSGLYARTTCRSEQGSYASPLDESLSQSFGVVHVSSLLWKGGISGSTLGALAHRVIHQDN